LATSNDVQEERPLASTAAAVPSFSAQAFEVLHAETFRVTWSIARRICRDEDEAQDACQMAYVAVYRYWRDGRLREAPRRLLFRATQRAAIDVVRSRSRRQRLEQRLESRSAAEAWEISGVRDALAGMKPEDSALLLLQAEAGLSYDELAAVMKQSVGAVRSRLFRARRELARRLDEAGT
jgi:RNA polymerase sigma-70 factor, ECF subfamily